VKSKTISLIARGSQEKGVANARDGRIASRFELGGFLGSKRRERGVWMLGLLIKAAGTPSSLP